MSDDNNKHPGSVAVAIGHYVEEVKADPHAAKITFRATSQWQGDTKAKVSIGKFMMKGVSAAPHGRQFTLTVDEPAFLGGTDTAPNPVEYLATALCGCLTAGIATNAELFGIALEKIEVSVEMNYDLIGLLGIDRDVPTGSKGINYTVRLKGKAGVTPQQLEKCKTVIDKKSAVLNTLKNLVPVTTQVIIE